MEKIEAFIDSAYQNVSGDSKEIQELKVEMKSHLLEAVHELKSEGKTEQEAIEIAIERFGGEQEIRSIINQLFKAQKAFAKWVLYSGISILFITVLLFSVFIITGNQYEKEQSDISYQIGDIVVGHDKISSTQKAAIQTLVNDTNYISNIRVYNLLESNKKGSNLNDEIPSYEYGRSLTGFSALSLTTYYYGGAEDIWVSFEIKDYRSLSFIVLFVGFASYWLLFSVWAIINAYHQKRLNTGWILSFIIFNVIGYLFFHIAGKRMDIN